MEQPRGDWDVTQIVSVGISVKYWSEWQDLNLRPPRPERGGPDCTR
jgi:hypothetical protein